MMATHVPCIDESMGMGLDERGERRPVRLILSGDYESQTTVVGRKGPNATMSCYQCKRTKAQSIVHAALHAKHGTLQDVLGPWHLRDADQYAHCVEDVANLGLSDHLSVTRAPLISPHPHQMAPIPVHLTLGINSRELRLVVEDVILCCSHRAGSASAHELFKLLHEEVHVHPVPYHGGVFIGRDCNAIGGHSDAVCAALEINLSGI